MTRSESYSSLQLLNHCERAYAYRYLAGYRPLVSDSSATLRGSAWHSLMQAHLLQRGAAEGTLLERPALLEIVDGLNLPLDWSEQDRPVAELPGGQRIYLDPWTIIVAVDHWWKELEPDRRDVLLYDLGATLMKRLWDTWRRYDARWCDPHLKPLLTEVKWERKSPGDRPLNGRVDAVLWDSKRNIVIVRDFKTQGAWPTQSEATIDLMNSQLHLMAWGVTPKLEQLSEGRFKPTAVEYDRTRWLMCGGTRKQLPSPKWNLNGSVSTSTTDFDEATFRETAHSFGHDIDEDWVDRQRNAGKYSFQPDDWFRRKLKPVSSTLIEQHIRSAERSISRTDYLTVDSSTISPSELCERCDFLKLCQTQMLSGLPEPLVLADYGLRKTAQK